MADHSLTPYLFSASPKGQPNDELKMMNLSKDPELSATNFFKNCLCSLVSEEKPREFGSDNTRLLDSVEVSACGDQILFRMKVGVTGFNSSLDLSALGGSATRKYSDPEWFNLRAMFINVPGSRKGLFIVERVANYSAYSLLSEILKTAARINFKDNVRVKFDAIQDMETMGQNLNDMLTKAIEFRTLMDPEKTDLADRVSGDDVEQPFEKIAKPSLKRYTKFTKRGGLGPFTQYRGKSVDELSEMFGYIPEEGQSTEITAKLEGDHSKSRTISIPSEEAQSVSFIIDRKNQDSEPSDDEFFKTVKDVVEGSSQLTSVNPGKLSLLSQYTPVVALQGVSEWRLDEEHTV